MRIVSPPERLTPYFLTQEFTATDTGLDNSIPDLETWCSIRALCSAILVPWRERVGSLHVSSGYRSDPVNRAIRGSSTSDHLVGRAADIIPIRARALVWPVLVDMVHAGLPVDQAIVYLDGRPHMHVSHRQGSLNRRQVLAFDGARYVGWQSRMGA